MRDTNDTLVQQISSIMFDDNAKYSCSYIGQKGSNLFLFDFYSLFLICFVFDVRNG